MQLYFLYGNIEAAEERGEGKKKIKCKTNVYRYAVLHFIQFAFPEEKIQMNIFNYRNGCHFY